MFRIYDGRETFFQWDLDRKLIVNDSSIKEVHFCNRTAECALPVATYKEGELTLVNVPNLILQESFRVNVYAYDENYTKHAARFEVIPRSKPDTYVYTETEIKTWDELFERIEQIEQNGISDAAVEAAVEKYLSENNINVDLTGYATETYVQEEIQKIELLPGPQGEKGEKGEKGDTGAQGPQGEPGADGSDYVLTEADKQEIAAMVEVSGDSGTCEPEVHVGADEPTGNEVLWIDTDEEAPDYQTAAQVQTAISTALSAIGVAEEGSY